MRIPLLIAGDEVGIIEIVAGIHAHAFRPGGGASRPPFPPIRSEILMPSTFVALASMTRRGRCPSPRCDRGCPPS